MQPARPARTPRPPRRRPRGPAERVPPEGPSRPSPAEDARPSLGERPPAADRLSSGVDPMDRGRRDRDARCYSDLEKCARSVDAPGGERGQCDDPRRWTRGRTTVDSGSGGVAPLDRLARLLSQARQLLTTPSSSAGFRGPKRKNSMSAVFLHVLLLLAAATAVQSRGGDPPRYETAYACEGKTLKIECRDGEVIQLIRANYGRFSITICNDHGNTDWSVNCMSTKSLRVLHTRCSSYQNCSILASTSMFGDPCPNTHKYLEAHYQCTTATTTSSTFRPSPPWLITSQPSVWRSTAASVSGGGAGAGAGAGVGSAPGGSGASRPSGVHHLAPPTLRPHITLPPDLPQPKVIKIKNDGHSPEVAKPPPANPPPPPPEEAPAQGPKLPPHRSPDTDTPREGFTESIPKKEEEGKSPSVDVERDRDTSIPAPPHERDREHPPAVDGDGNRRHHHHHHENPDAPGAGLPLWRHCSPQGARGLQWNWTSVGEVAVQPCPGGATGLARWRCVSSAHRLSHLQQQRRLGAPSRETGSAQSRAPILIDETGSDSLLNGRDVEMSPDMTDFRDMETLMLPDPQASSGDPDSLLQTSKPYGGVEGQPVWISENPDLSECRSVWLNSLETRVKEGESLLSISNDLSQVTSSKTLYGGDMMTTTNIMKRLAQRMALNIQSFPDPRQREAIVTDLLLGVVKTGSNLLDESQQASWKDLSHPAQMRVATSLLIGLEENAFLLAEAVLREKTIIQQVKNILLSVRVLETRNVETEEFPSSQAREQWTASQDSIHLPRGALIDNSEGGLVRIVFVAFDRLEEILQPPAVPWSPTAPPPVEGPPLHPSMNSHRDRDNVTRLINSKVISASLGKGRHIQLSQPVRLTLRHLRTHNVTNPTCVFWDYTVNVWSAEGCRVEWSNATHTGCQCSHLTNFALLMDVHDVALPASHALALHLITVAGCAVSVVALLFATLVFHCFKGMKSDRITIHKNLCACLLIAEVIFMFGIEQTANRVFCGVIAALLHYFFLAAFAWMFLEGFQLYAMLVEVFEPERARARWYYPAAYLAPLVVVAASAAADHASYGTSRHCWLRADNYFILSFVVPVAFVLLANWVCLCMVIYMMCHHSNVSIKTKENNKLYKIKIWLRSSVFLAVLLGLTWTFGLLYLNEETVFMAYMFTALNSLQGLFIFIFHCLLNETVQKECARLGRRHRWLSCCARLAPAPSAPAATASSSAPAPAAKRPRHQDDQCLEDVSEHEHAHAVTQRYTLKHQHNNQQQAEQRAWNTGTVRPSAPAYTPASPASHSLSMPSIPPAPGPAPALADLPDLADELADLQDLRDLRDLRDMPRPSSPGCFSVKTEGWGVVQNPLSVPGSGTWKSTSSKHQQQVASSGSLQHGEHVRRDSTRPRHHRTHDPNQLNHVQHVPRQHHYHPHSHHHTYSEIGSRYRRGSDQEFRDIHDDPVYEEIERNETLMSDMSDDNSGHGDGFVRQVDQIGSLAHHGGSSKFYGDHRPLISYSPGERHRYDRSPVALDHQIPHGKYSTGRWDSLERHGDPRVAYGYHPQEGSNMRALAAVLNGDNDVASKVLCPGHGHPQHPRTVLPSYSDC